MAECAIVIVSIVSLKEFIEYFDLFILIIWLVKHSCDPQCTIKVLILLICHLLSYIRKWVEVKFKLKALLPVLILKLKTRAFNELYQTWRSVLFVCKLITRIVWNILLMRFHTMAIFYCATCLVINLFTEHMNLFFGKFGMYIFIICGGSVSMLNNSPVVLLLLRSVTSHLD